MADFGITNAYGYGQYSASEQGYFSAPAGDISKSGEAKASKLPGKGFGISATEEAEGKKPLEFNGCETCRKRTYVDGSNESDVSFKTPGHIDPGASAMVVAGHEREHVANAIQKASQPGAKLIQASVRLITSICPECGRSYVAGGVTNTVIQFNKDKMSQSQKQAIGEATKGNKVDYKI